MDIKYKRGDVHPDKELYYWGINMGKPYWVTLDNLTKLRAKAAAHIKKKRYVNIDETREQSRAYYEKTKEASREYQRQWRAKNLERRRQQQRRRSRERRKEDPLYLLKGRVKGRINNVLRRKCISKKSNTGDIIGCSWDALKAHIESQFTDGMSWDNRSKWHIDHRIPLAAATNEEEVLKLCHYTNLQPMWAKCNLVKNDKHCPKELATFLD